LWAPIFKVPTIAVYKTWSHRAGQATDTRPISFGAPVIYAPLNGDPAEVYHRCMHGFDGTMGSTPLR
jgi:hypothetical protein